MFDLHCHIIPQMDDGSRSMEESVAMAELAVKCGTKVIAATSHSNIPGHFPVGWRGIYEKKLAEVQQVLKDRGCPLQLVPGTEIFGTEDVPEKLRDGRLFTINHTHYPLVEFDFGVDEFFIFDLMEALLMDGYTPILAHPERYDCIQENPQAVYELYGMGVVIQSNKDSILGRFGPRVERTAHALLRNRLVALVASDAHRCDRRTTNLANLERLLADYYGSDCAELLLYVNPERVLQDQKVHWASPLPFEWER